MRARERGFTLFEMLVVMVIIGLAASAISVSMRGASTGTKVKSTVLLISSRLRGLRSQALANSSERTAIFDLDRNTVSFQDGRAPIVIDRSVSVTLTSADSERVSSNSSGIRFFANGSSSGGAIRINSRRQQYVIRVNWLTGRVSVDAS